MDRPATRNRWEINEGDKKWFSLILHQATRKPGNKKVNSLATIHWLLKVEVYGYTNTMNSPTRRWISATSTQPKATVFLKQSTHMLKNWQVWSPCHVHLPTAGFSPVFHWELIALVWRAYHKPCSCQWTTLALTPRPLHVVGTLHGPVGVEWGRSLKKGFPKSLLCYNPKCWKPPHGSDWADWVPHWPTS